MSFNSAITFILLYLIRCNNGARVLAVFPIPAVSHQASFQPITQELVKRGHHVTVITTNPAFQKHGAPKNLREIDVHDITYGLWKEMIRNIPTGKEDAYVQAEMTLKSTKLYVESQLQAPEVEGMIQNKNDTFDLILAEHCAGESLVYSHIYKVPVIEISSFGAVHGDVYSARGAPSHPILYPTCLQQKLFNLSMWEKIKFLYQHYVLGKLYEDHLKLNVKKNKIFEEDTPSILELKDNVAMVLLNVHRVWENNRPVPPNIVYLGGVHQKPEKNLPEDLKSYLDSSKHGVIYFSLGTSVQPSLLPPERVQVMLKVFSKLPYDVLWKYDKDHLPGRPSNVRIIKWVPQADLLRHANIKLFITQGGLQSTDEAITAGVPFITLPILGDQWYNAERHAHHKIGVKLDLETLTEDIFNEAIGTVIGDVSYRRNVEKLHHDVYDKPQISVERAVWCVEYVLNYGGNHLKSPAAKMTWSEYYEIQLVVIVFCSLLAIVFLVVYTTYAVWRYMGHIFWIRLKCL